MSIRSRLANQQGLALLMTVFIVTLATIIVMDIANRARYDRRSVRAFTEGVQADYVLKSGLNLARLLLEAPKLEGVQEDWLGEPWALIGAAPSLPVSGLPSDFRIEIVDEDGKIDINSIASSSGAGAGGGFPTPANPQQQQSGVPSPTQIWEEALVKLFQNQGFMREQYDPLENRTIGNIAYGAEDEAAVISDWIDADTESRRMAAGGDGIESQAPREWFYNRQIKSISELLNVPGMTLERVRRISPFVKASSDPGIFTRKINVNTAPLPVLIAIGIPENVASSLVQSRLAAPVTSENLRNLTTGSPQLTSILKTTSSSFTVYGRVGMPNTTRWLRASLSVQPGTTRRAQVKSLEMH